MTKPITEVLPIPMQPGARALMSVCYETVHELVCFGTHMLVWSLEENKGKEQNELAAAVPLLYRHILEQLDSISVQIHSGVITPCRLQLRVMLEAFLSLEYMLEKDREERAARFFIVDHYRKLNFYKKHIPGTREYEIFTAELKGHSQLWPDLFKGKDMSELYANSKSLIALPHYQIANNEYLLRTKNNSRNLENLKWYSLNGGPESLYELSKRLKRYDWYEYLYKPWSNPIHGTDLHSNVLVQGDDGYGAFNQLRNMQDAIGTTEITIALSVSTVELLGKKVLSNHKKEIGTWAAQFEEQYRAPFMKLKQRYRETNLPG